MSDTVINIKGDLHGDPKAFGEKVSREMWLAERRKGVGASEVAAILGLDPWRTALGVWADKALDISEDKDSEAMEIGRELEEPIARMWHKRHPGWGVNDPGRHAIKRHPDAPLTCTLDRIIYAGMVGIEPDKGVLEIKASSKTEEWAGGPPLRYIVQVQAQLAVTGYQWGYLVALLGGRRLVEHRVERDDVFIAKMLDEVRTFWNLVETKQQPDVTKPYDLAVVKLLHPKDSGVTFPADIPGEAFVASYEEAKAAKSEADKRFELAEAALRQHVGDATWMMLADGRKVACKVEPRKAELCKSCSAEVRKATEPRVLRLSKGRT